MGANASSPAQHQPALAVAEPGPSSSAPFAGNVPRVVVRGTAVPVNYLVRMKEEAPAHAYQTEQQQKRAYEDTQWAQNRDIGLATAAIAMHTFILAYSICSWGHEATIPDRYWPAPRLQHRIHPGRYGNVEGTKRIYYEWLAKSEGIP